MKYLIDTHIFLWLIFEPGKLSKNIIDTLKNSSNQVCISSISFWEISLKFNLGKLELNGISPEELPDIAAQMDIEVLDVGSKTMASFHQLKKVDKHKDPFDRIVIGFCLLNDYILVSQDGKFSAYEELGLSTLTAPKIVR
ncbi:type II toxin-antitoxin system VapC family toxin [sulfur-oxidizing endosymbiont of Gigantopelta aegis]|uniref:type II toxin-antitoxin system VapC family toxin n=1 Tax=sulfur-oxidizing endosymbiont of Gigantopelta aegis TaxID=2794934 RepID=UPI0018DCB54B|nr:type II toxin-antitoxin system VapC family toxin [sulfur-oxidizing endosymbiont of Gigantopelta aegis]